MHQAGHPLGSNGLDDGLSALDIGVVKSAMRPPRRGQRRRMNDNICAPEGTFEHGAIRDVSGNERDTLLGQLGACF